MVTVDSTEFLSNLVYSSSAKSIVSSQDQEDNQTKSMCLWSAVCAGTLKPEYVCAKTEMRQAARISLSGLTPVRAVSACRPSQTSEFIVSDADISCGRLLTLSWLLLEESKFLLHI